MKFYNTPRSLHRSRSLLKKGGGHLARHKSSRFLISVRPVPDFQQTARRFWSTEQSIAENVGESWRAKRLSSIGVVLFLFDIVSMIPSFERLKRNPD
jgi:hypothetical protein